MMMTRIALLFLTAALLSPIVASAADVAWITGFTVATPRNDFDGTLGGKLTVAGTGQTLTQLGRLCLTGNSQTHNVFLTHADGSIMLSVPVNMSGCTPGVWVYAAATPTALVAGTSYYVYSAETNGGDTWYDITAITVTSVATSPNAVLTIGAGGGSPIDAGTANQSFGITNFKYSVPTVPTSQPFIFM